MNDLGYILASFRYKMKININNDLLVESEDSHDPNRPVP